MRKFISVVLAASMAAALLAGCGGSSSSSSSSSGSDSSSSAEAAEEEEEAPAEAVDAIELSMNVTTSESSVWMVAAETFKERVEEETGGRYIINIYPNEQLSSGDLVKGCEMLFTGVTDLDLHSCINMTSFEEKLQVVTLPWLFPNGYDSVDEILFNGTGGEYLMELVRGKGAEPLALCENGFRQITNNKRPITKPEDLAGLKIRTPPITLYIDMFKLLGADPTTMSFSEVFTALQQGTIDGQENPWDTIRSAQIQEVQKYLTVWNYSYDPIVLSASSKLWESLSEEDQAIFKAAAEEGCAAQIEASRAMDAEIKQQFIDEGVEVYELNEDEIAAFQEAVAPIFTQYADIVGEEALTAFGYELQ